MYPGSFHVAVALHRAADNGVIDASALEATSMGTASDEDLNSENSQPEFKIGFLNNNPPMYNLAPEARKMMQNTMEERGVRMINP